MLQLTEEILAFTRACEHLLSRRPTLTDDERGLLEYYVNDLSRQFLLNSSSHASKSVAQQTLPI
jgi:hypothetical protein